MTTVATSVVSVKRRLADEAEAERQKTETIERRRQELLRRERAAKRREFILRKAEEFSRYERLRALLEFLLRGRYRYGDEPADRLIDELKALVESMGQSFRREALCQEIGSLHLFGEGDG